MVLTAFSNTALSQKYTPKYLKDDNKEFKKLAKVITEDGWIEFRTDTSAVKASDFLNKYKSELGIGADYELRLLKKSKDKLNLEHQQYQLFYKKIPVEGSFYSIHYKDDRLLAAQGMIVLDLEMDVLASIQESAALLTALSAANTNAEDAQKEGKKIEGVLLLAQCKEDFLKESYCLAYAFDLTDKKDNSPYRIYVDARSGQVIKRIPLYQNCFESSERAKSLSYEPVQVSSGQTVNLSPKVTSTFIPNHVRYLAGQSTLSFETLPSGNNFALRFNTNVGSALHVQQDLNANVIFDDGDILNPTTNWANNNPNATTAHWVIQKMYQYMLATFGRNGVDGNSNLARVSIDVPLTDNAVWQHPSNQMKIGVRRFTGVSMSTLDIVSHELMHGYTDHMVLGAGYPSTSLEFNTMNEAFSDMFATVMEHELLPNDWNWRIGEDVLLIRDMQNPELSPDPQPRTYLGPNWSYSTNDGPHRNNGFLNRWFFLITDGDDSPVPLVFPIGMDRSTNIVYRVIDDYLQPSSGFQTFKNATLFVSNFLYGECSHESRQVINAWNLVGYSTNYVCPVDCNYTITTTVNPTSTSCGSPITLTANCVGSGCNYVLYAWSGPGVIANEQTRNQTLNITAPSSPGINTYDVIFSKADCPSPNYSSVTVTTNCGLPLSNGCYTIKAKHSDKYMQPENGNNGARIRQYSANGQSSQVFELEAVDGDSYKIKPYGTGKAWEVSNSGTEYGSAIQQWDYFGGSNQKWLVSGWGDGSYRLAPKHAPTLVADVEGTSISDGAGLHLWGQRAGDNQRFYISSVGCPGGGGCPAPNLSANPGTISPGGSRMLTANGCSGTVTWSNGLGTGNTKSVNPGSTTTYTATCTVNGCTSGNGSVTVTVDQSQSGACISLGDQCSGNSAEIRNYNINLSSGGSKAVTLNYRAHEGNGTGRIRINGGSWQTFPLNQTPGDLSYQTTGIGSYSFNSGNNTVELASGGGFLCFRELCTDGGGGGNPDCNFSAFTNPSTINTTPNGSITLSASCSGSGCSGVSYAWSGNGASSSSASYSLNAPGTAGTYVYTVTLSKSGCNSQSAQVTVYVGSQSNDCINLGDQCSGNQYEIRSYTISLSSGGNRAVTLTYRAHEGNATGRIRINGGSWQTFPLNQTPGDLSYLTTGIGSYSFNSGSNTVELASGGGFLCFRELCAGNSGGRIGTAEATTVESQELRVSPNPNNGQFEASFFVEPGRRAVLRVTDMQGREVWQKALKGEGNQKETVHLPTQAVGSYILLLSKEATTSAGQVEYKKVVVVK